MNATPDSSSFERLNELQRLLRERGQHQAGDGAQLDALVEASHAIASVSSWAAALELGHDGFDNTEQSRHYHLVQTHLRAAGDDLVEACLVLASGSSARK